MSPERLLFFLFVSIWDEWIFGEDFVHGVGAFSRQGFGDVLVNVLRDRDVAVAELVADELDVDALG